MKQWIAVLMALLAVGTLTAQISIPNTFTANTRIVSADVNENFNELGSKALNREGGAMSGDLAVENLTFGAHNTYDIGSTGTRARDGWFGRNVAITGTLGVTGVTTVGTINATTITGAGAGITGVAEANITDGSVLARVAADETVTGTWVVSNATPQVRLLETGVTSNNGGWRFIADSENFYLQTANDAFGSVGTPLQIERTANTTDLVAITSTATTVSGSLAVGGGTAITAVLMGTKSWNPGSLADNASETTTVTVTGVSSSAACFASSLVSESATPKNDFFFSVYYASSNTVNVTLLNKSGATVNPDNNTLRVTCFNY